MRGASSSWNVILKMPCLLVCADGSMFLRSIRWLVNLLFDGVGKSGIAKVGVGSREFRDCVFKFCGWECCTSGCSVLCSGGKKGKSSLQKEGRCPPEGRGIACGRGGEG